MSAALLLAALLAAVPADTLVVGTLADPASLEPHQATDIVAAEIVANVCETLVRVRPGSLRPEGVLATTWASPDQRVWTFTLREGVRFHDGAPLDADAVVGNLEHLRRERAFPGRAERVGPHVVQITLDRPNAALLSTLSQPFFAMQSPRRLAGAGERAAGRHRALPPGARPARPRRARGVRRALGRRPPPAPPRVPPLPRRGALSPGRSPRGRPTSPPRSAPAAPRRCAPTRRSPSTPRPGSTSSTWPSTTSGRRSTTPACAAPCPAPSTAPRLVREVLGGHAEPAHTALPPTLFGHDTRARELVLDRDAARRLLAAARVPEGFETTLTVSRAPAPLPPRPAPRRGAAARRPRRASASPFASARWPTWTEHVDLTSRGDFDLALLGWQADTLDPNDFLTALLDSGSIGTTNRSRYRSPAMDGLLKRARMDSAPGTRLALYRAGAGALPAGHAVRPALPLLRASPRTAGRCAAS